MRAAAAFCALMLVFCGAPARASARVIELFTSQGCGKCPPADRLIADLAREPDTIALSFPVNYWDYAGWADTLAKPAFTARQHAYAAARGDRQVFTPQAIVDGLVAEPGADKAAILRAPARSVVPPIIALSQADGRLHVEIGGRAPASEPRLEEVGIYILRVARRKTVQIARGVNSGHSVTYTNVVRSMRRLGDWTIEPARFDIVDLKEEDEGYVVLLQAGQPDRLGAILAAAKTDDL